MYVTPFAAFRLAKAYPQHPNAIKLTNKFQKKEKSLDKGKKMCGKALKTRLIFRGRAHEIHS